MAKIHLLIIQQIDACALFAQTHELVSRRHKELIAIKEFNSLLHRTWLLRL